MAAFSLIVELLLLALGVYIYLFSRGAIKTKDPERQKRSEAFRKENAGWMRILGLGLAAVMLLNVILHVAELLN
jgi:hypothetical protein